MERKLIKQGGGGYTIYLPKKWIDRKGLKEGDHVEIIEQERNLIINTQKENETEQGIVNLKEMGALANRSILALYKRGCDEIIVKYQDPKEVEKLQKVIAELIGFEIVNQTRSECILKEISKTQDEDFDNLLRRSFLLVKLMGEEIHTSIKEKKDASHVVNLDLSVNKFTNYCIRILNRRGHQDPKKTNEMYSVINYLERLGDILKKMSLMKPKKSSELLTFLGEYNQLMEAYIKIFFKFEKQDAVDFAMKWQSLINKMSKAKEDRMIQLVEDITNILIKIFNEQMTYDL